ncbi:unnamed protein product [Sphagnum balticum]
MVILSRASTSSSTSCRYTTCGAPLVTKNQILQRFQYKDLEAATGGFDRENLIGRANHGQIYRGVLKDGRVVAVKRPIVGHHLWKDDDAFQNEIEILSKLFSRRLVNLLGYSCDGKVRLLVVEFMENGTLHDLLHGGGGGRAANLSWALRINLALQTAKAIRALHASSPPIIHRNIKASNVYIDRHCCARLGDFGLARYMQHVVSLRSAAGAGRARQSSVNCVLSSISETDDRDLRDQARPWSAVEDWIAYGNVEGPNQTKSEISPKNDVFSFGMLLLELITGSAPVFMSEDFAPLSLVDWTLPLIKQGNALAILDPQIALPENTAALKHMADVAGRCVSPVASRRPSMDEVVQSLTKVGRLIPLPFWGGCSGKQQRGVGMMETSGHRLRRITRLLKLPSFIWTGFFKFKKRAFIAGLGKFIRKRLKQAMRFRSRTRPVSSSSSSTPPPLGVPPRSATTLKVPGGVDERMPEPGGSDAFHEHQIATASLVQGTKTQGARVVGAPTPFAVVSNCGKSTSTTIDSNFTRQYFTRMPSSASNFQDRT